MSVDQRWALDIRNTPRRPPPTVSAVQTGMGDAQLCDHWTFLATLSALTIFCERVSSHARRSTCVVKRVVPGVGAAGAFRRTIRRGRRGPGVAQAHNRAHDGSRRCRPFLVRHAALATGTTQSSYRVQPLDGRRAGAPVAMRKRRDAVSLPRDEPTVVCNRPGLNDRARLCVSTLPPGAASFERVPTGYVAQ